MIWGNGLGMDVLIYSSDACGLFDRVAQLGSVEFLTVTCIGSFSKSEVENGFEVGIFFSIEWCLCVYGGAHCSGFLPMLGYWFRSDSFTVRIQGSISGPVCETK